ncbi:MAG TPA: response regulator [Candidatus Dormibacteraeota bacterium]|nr:response regulator [Candidatus Dormibacteraeota bacterium]
MDEFQEITPREGEERVDGHRRTIEVDSELWADVGHQLRNQLNAVVGAAGLLSTGAESSEERELAAIVETGAEQVARIVDEVLDAVTIESGEFELALHPFDVRSTVESCLALVVDAAGAKGLDLSFHAAPDVPNIAIGDSRRIEQILLTLLHGAVDRTYRGGIGVELRSEDRGGLVALSFTIRDTGRGVPARILRGGLEGVTGPYDRLEPGDRLAVLSLHTTKHLVEMMDGELRVEQGGVEAGPDAGTTFGFTILAEALPGGIGTTLLTLEGMRVLVVAADPTEKRVLALQVEQWGANATAGTPEEAQAAVQIGRPFDIALIEHRAPSIDGLEISRNLRTAKRPDQMPIVIIASSTPGADEAAAADSGVIQAMLTKPVPPRTLHDVMLQVGGRGAEPGLPTPSARAPQEVVPGSLRVLIADDNALNQNLLKRLVTKLGHTVDVVSNGREAVAAVAQTPYDAVLMDVLMPEMDGLAAAEAICRRWPRGNRPRLIALTAMAGPGDQERCLRAGYDDYMSKPIRTDDLADALRAAVGYRTNTERAGL